MNTLLSLKNNVSKIQNLIISGEVGATGPTGPQGNRGTALDVNFFGDLDNTKLAEVLNDSQIKVDDNLSFLVKNIQELKVFARDALN